MPRTIVEEFPLLEHPISATDASGLTEICTLLPAEPAKESKVS
jgi:hypothetical protein